MKELPHGNRASKQWARQSELHSLRSDHFPKLQGDREPWGLVLALLPGPCGPWVSHLKRAGSEASYVTSLCLSFPSWKASFIIIDAS